MYLMGMEYSTSETIFPDEERIELIKKNQEKRLEVAWPVFVSNLQSQMPHASKAKRESLRGRIKNGKQVLENADHITSTSTKDCEHGWLCFRTITYRKTLLRRCWQFTRRQWLQG